MSSRTVSVDGDVVTITHEDTCRDCRWWRQAVYEKEPTNDYTCGYCTRFPPYCEIIGEDDGHGQKLMGHPLRYVGAEVCGEFTAAAFDRW